jgi:hypothetical protein
MESGGHSDANECFPQEGRVVNIGEGPNRRSGGTAEQAAKPTGWGVVKIVTQLSGKSGARAPSAVTGRDTIRYEKPRARRAVVSSRSTASPCGVTVRVILLLSRVVSWSRGGLIDRVGDYWRVQPNETKSARRSVPSSILLVLGKILRVKHKTGV